MKENLSQSILDPRLSFRLRGELFCKIRKPEQLASLFDCTVDFLENLAEKPFYDEFDIPKKNGGVRHIEDPDDTLKEILRMLNEYLQIVYYGIRSEAAYGFMIVPAFDESPRNIRNNALRHLNKEWMLNADFRDFFHQISYQDIHDIFCCTPFDFPEELATILAKLTTYKGRLPMGSPTSPALSNFATRLLDADLTALARHKQWVYTRFADDLTFSSHEPIQMEHFEQIRYICDGYGLAFNPDKIRFLMPHEIKTVTGLIVTNRIDIPNDFIESLNNEISKLAVTLEINYRTGKHSTKWLQNYRKQIEGAIEFIRQIEGARSPDYMAIRKRYAEAIASAEIYSPISWIDFGYLNFM